ncbi:MAG: LytTR family transcriptional regulator [Acetivibrio sp.]
MGNFKKSDYDVIEMTQNCLHGFYERHLDDVTKNMSKDFVWIGGYDFQYIQGLEDFLRIIKVESQEPPLTITNEEYHLLFHERNVWIVYGRYEITAILKNNNSVLHAHVRVTAVWRKENNKLELCHLHGSHSQDIPLHQSLTLESPLNETMPFFDTICHLNVFPEDEETLELRDRNNNYHFIRPSEILYLRAAKQWSMVFTLRESFEVRGILGDFEKTLPKQFFRIHKSYLLNISYIDSIRRFTALLKDKTELPIGKERYMDLKACMYRKK